MQSKGEPEVNCVTEDRVIKACSYVVLRRYIMHLSFKIQSRGCVWIIS